MEIENFLQLLSAYQVMEELYHHLLFIKGQITIWVGTDLQVGMKNEKSFGFHMLRRDRQIKY